MFAVKKTLLVAGFAVLLGSGAVQAQTGQPGMMGPGMMGQGQMRHGQMDQGQMPYFDLIAEKQLPAAQNKIYVPRVNQCVTQEFISTDNGKLIEGSGKLRKISPQADVRRGEGDLGMKVLIDLLA